MAATAGSGSEVPVYALPPDLVRARPEDAAPNEDGRQPLGRYQASYCDTRSRTMNATRGSIASAGGFGSGVHTVRPVRSSMRVM